MVYTFKKTQSQHTGFLFDRPYQVRLRLFRPEESSVSIFLFGVITVLFQHLQNDKGGVRPSLLLFLFPFLHRTRRDSHWQSATPPPP